jgi:predicted 3-demethylubiquinone-9 3-methyltransferase (glyoxalase superfamily)
MAQRLNIVPCLWCDGRALEAAEFYISLFPDSRIDQILRSSVDAPGCKPGDLRWFPIRHDYLACKCIGERHDRIGNPKNCYP